MSAAAVPSGGGGEEAGGGGKKKVDGEGRGKRVPLAGRPLFTSVASTKVDQFNTACCCSPLSVWCWCCAAAA